MSIIQQQVMPELDHNARKILIHYFNGLLLKQLGPLKKKMGTDLMLDILRSHRLFLDPNYWFRVPMQNNVTNPNWKQIVIKTRSLDATCEHMREWLGADLWALYYITLDDEVVLFDSNTGEEYREMLMENDRYLKYLLNNGLFILKVQQEFYVLYFKYNGKYYMISTCEDPDYDE
jgi:hypothetical protein